MAISAQSIAQRIQNQLGSGWKEPSVDGFVAGNLDIDVHGIGTTYAPSLEVLRKAVASGRNLIISRESPYWARASGAGAGGPRNALNLEQDPIYRLKRDYIAANNLAVYRLFDNWNARQPDAQLQALSKALGWDSYYKPSGGAAWGTNNGFFDLPPATLRATAQHIKQTLKMKSIRCGGNPNITVRRAALSHGMYWLPDLRKLLAEPGVDLVVLGEPQWENELSLYNFDLHAAGIKTGMIVLGQEISEEPGCGAMATWIKSFVPELPVEWIATGEPSWMPYQQGALA